MAKHDRLRVSGMIYLYGIVPLTALATLAALIAQEIAK